MSGPNGKRCIPTLPSGAKPDEHGLSVLERALKKSGWRGPYETGAQRLQHVLDHRRTKRQEHGHGSAQGLLSRAKRSRGSSVTLRSIPKVSPMPWP